MSWKTRLKSNRPTGSSDYGSFYVILPKGQIEQIGWRPTQPLRSRVTSEGLLIRAADPDPRAPLVKHADHLPGDQIDRILCGDVLERLKALPDESVHLAITSPPYNVGIEYQGYEDRRAYEDYRRWLSMVWAELYRVLVRGGRFVLEIAPTGIHQFVPLHYDLAWDIRSAGFEHRAEIVWAKQNMTAKRTAWGSFKSPSHPHVIPSWEYVEVFHKQSWKLEGDRALIDITSKEFVEWSNGVWEIGPETRRIANHPAAFPEELIYRLVRYFSYQGNTILDMFGGTGTVAYVAKWTDRHYIHIDQSPDYCKIAEQRLPVRPTWPWGHVGVGVPAVAPPTTTPRRGRPRQKKEEIPGGVRLSQSSDGAALSRRRPEKRTIAFSASR
ncbi:MAG: site-specific DNA-methyltransferase [Thermoplasmata archaeon]